MPWVQGLVLELCEGLILNVLTPHPGSVRCFLHLFAFARRFQVVNFTTAFSRNSTIPKSRHHGPQAKAAVRCLLEAVAYIHGHGIMHRPTVYCIRELLVVRRMCISQSLQALEEIYVQKILNCL